MSSIYYCSNMNSTHFTTCCRVAICADEQKCPRCRMDIYPFYEGMDEKEREESAGGNHNHNTQRARDVRAKRSAI